MDARNKIDNIYRSLENTENKSLFGVVSPLYFLDHPPIPLNTYEMHSVSGDIIRNAKSEVLLEFYKFSINSDGGKEIYLALEDLKAKAEREKIKINVCMLVNSRGTLAESLYKRNNPIDLDSLASSEYFNIKLTLHSTAAFGTLHTKMIIVDSQIAMIRGGDPDVINDFAREQIETATLLRGPIASIMRNDFNEVWFAYCNESLADFQFVEEGSQKNPEFNPMESLSIPCLFLSKRENGNPLYYTDCESPYKIALLQAILEATLSINIMTSNLNDSDICQALARACNRDVAVNIITGKHHNDSTESWWGGTNFNSLASIVRQVDPVHQANLSIRWATNSYGDIICHGDKHTIHAKYVCIDNELVFVGSSPLDIQGMRYSREADIIFSHEPTAKLFNTKLFSEKFTQGKDYFEEAYFRIRNQIELHTNRIENSATTSLRISKYARLRQTLMIVSTKKCSLREKLYLLLESTLPLFQIQTGNKPGMPESYNAIIAYAIKYGLDQHINIQTCIPQPEPIILASHFNLFPSTSPHCLERKRSLSDLSLSSSEHDNGTKNDKIDLRKSM